VATEVKHGPHPTFKAPLTLGRYKLVIQGRYTKQAGMQAGGVTEIRFNSDRPTKRQAELLGMRTIFVCWFLDQWLQTGGTWPTGVKALTEYPYGRLRASGGVRLRKMRAPR
jgi:hypothetical protein